MKKIKENLNNLIKNRWFNIIFFPRLVWLTIKNLSLYLQEREVMVQVINEDNDLTNFLNENNFIATNGFYKYLSTTYVIKDKEVYSNFVNTMSKPIIKRLIESDLAGIIYYRERKGDYLEEGEYQYYYNLIFYPAHMYLLISDLNDLKISGIIYSTLGILISLFLFL